MSWTQGYVSEIDYTFGCYRELSPLMLDLCLMSRQQARRRGRPMRYLELGFGQGLSLNIYAAVHEGEFWGTDFNPAQAANARDMAEACGSQARILDDSFAELAARDDLPEFDVIVAHGIWTWVSEENRRIIVDLVRRKLAVGGMFMVSYNCAPGVSAVMPLRDLIALHAEQNASSTQDMSARIKASLEFAQSLVDAKASFFESNPAVRDRLKKISGENSKYLAHEYFNADWHPMPFSQVARTLADAKLTYASSAFMMDNIDDFNLATNWKTLLAGIADPIMRETVRDYCVNQQFRRDIYVKGARPLSAAQKQAAMAELRFALNSHADDVPLTVTTSAVTFKLKNEMFKPIIDFLAADNYRPKSYAEFARQPQFKNWNSGQLEQSLFVLVGGGKVSPALDDAAAERALPRTQALNAHIFERAVQSDDIAYAACPYIGGVFLGRFGLLFARAIKAGKSDPAEWAKDVWDIFRAQSQRVMRDGAPLQTDEENLAALTADALVFKEKHLPRLQALKII